MLCILAKVIIEFLTLRVIFPDEVIGEFVTFKSPELIPTLVTEPSPPPPPPPPPLPDVLITPVSSSIYNPSPTITPPKVDSVAFGSTYSSFDISFSTN